MNTEDTAAVNYALDTGATWDYIEYQIAGHFLPALINDDHSGLDGADIVQLARFDKRARKAAIDAGALAWHWSAGDDSGSFSRCDVCGLRAECYVVQMVILIKGDK